VCDPLGCKLRAIAQIVFSGLCDCVAETSRLKVHPPQQVGEARVVAPTVSRLGFLSPPQTHGLEFAVGERPPEPFRRAKPEVL